MSLFHAFGFKKIYVVVIFLSFERNSSEIIFIFAPDSYELTTLISHEKRILYCCSQVDI